MLPSIKVPCRSVRTNRAVLAVMCGTLSALTGISESRAATKDPIEVAWAQMNYREALNLLEQVPPAARSIDRLLTIATADLNLGDNQAAKGALDAARAKGGLTPAQVTRADDIELVLSARSLLVKIGAGQFTSSFGQDADCLGGGTKDGGLRQQELHKLKGQEEAQKKLQDDAQNALIRLQILGPVN